MQIRKPRHVLQILRDLIVGLCIALLLSSCGSNTRPTEPANVTDAFATPPFYRITGHGGGSLLLMGTIHLGPPEGWQFSRAVLAGLDDADRFVLEIDLRKVTDQAVSTLLANTAVLQPPNTLPDLVSPETAKLLDEHEATLARMGMPRNARKWKKPWYIALWLIESMSTQTGFVASTSADSAILAAIGMRPLIGLETFEEQLGIFDDLSPQLQDVMLQDTLMRLDSAVEDTRILVEAWRRGDERKLQELAREGVDELPGRKEFYDVILTDRNQKWLTVFRSLLDEPEHAGETIFVGVGALHLVGDDGLVHLLRQSGYTARRVDPSTRRRK